MGDKLVTFWYGWSDRRWCPAYTVRRGKGRHRKHMQLRVLQLPHAYRNNRVHRLTVQDWVKKSQPGKWFPNFAALEMWLRHQAMANA